jgi:TfoX/Sxy family transcriptional regulator of competence genes
MDSMTAESEFARLADDLEDAGVVKGRMFGADTLLHDGKLIACLKNGLEGFKLGETTDEFAAARTLPGASLFAPAGEGRPPFKGWVAFSAEHADVWLDLAQQALSLRHHA